MTLIDTIVALVLPCLIVLGTFGFWRRASLRWKLVDEPGNRKIHHEPTSLAGGVAIFTCTLFGLLLYLSLRYLWGGLSLAEIASHYGVWVFLLAGFFALGLVDDLRELKAAPKLFAQLFLVVIAALKLSLEMMNLESPWILLILFLTVFWFGVILNSLNFLDNMNGLCTGLGVIVLSVFYLQHLIVFGGVSLGVEYLIFIGALLGFLKFNYPRAQAFLGDSGSQMVGYLTAAVSVKMFYSLTSTLVAQSQSRDCTSLCGCILLGFLPVFMALSIPLYDLCTTFYIRWRLKKPLYLGDTNHISHRLVRRGWSPAMAVGLIWSATGAMGIASLVFTFFISTNHLN